MEHAKLNSPIKIIEHLAIRKNFTKRSSGRDWGIFNYITVWMGAVHNIMSYMTVAGFCLRIIS